MKYIYIHNNGTVGPMTSNPVKTISLS